MACTHSRHQVLLNFPPHLFAENQAKVGFNIRRACQSVFFFGCRRSQLLLPFLLNTILLLGLCFDIQIPSVQFSLVLSGVQVANLTQNQMQPFFAKLLLPHKISFSGHSLWQQPPILTKKCIPVQEVECQQCEQSVFHAHLCNGRRRVTYPVATKAFDTQQQK